MEQTPSRGRGQQPPNLDAAEITRLKDLNIGTVLAAAGVPKATIIAPSNGRYDEGVKLVQQAVREATGVTLRVVADNAKQGAVSVAPRDLLSESSVIVLGNMSTSAFVYTLYRQYYTFLDLRYPGRNGYVVRSLHDPYATGNNVLLLGGSDDAGVLKAARRFVDTLEGGDPLTVGWRMDVQLGDDVPKPPEPEDAARNMVFGWSDSSRWDSDGTMIGRSPLSYSGWNPFSTQAALYYTTGEEKYLREFLRLAIPDSNDLPEQVRALHVERSETGQYDLSHPIAMAHHYVAHRMPLLWDLIEESPLLTDEQRLRITNDLRWNCELVTGYGIGHSRHGIYAGLTAHTAARYFSKYYPADRWSRLLERVHDNFMRWQEQPTSWGEGDQLPWINTCLHPVVIYFMISDPQSWIDSGMAQTVLETLPAIWSGRPHEPAVEAQGLNLMHRAAWLLGDGRYTYMARQADYDYGLFRIGQSWWPSPELEAVPPTDLVGRVSVVPLSESDAERAGIGFDAHEGFQYITYRSGLGPNDGFLMLDGFDGRRRNPHHVSALAYLRSGGRELLSGYGNQVSVLRNGLSENHVAMASRLRGAFSGEKMAYIGAVVPDYAYSSWQRDILWVDDCLTLVVDALTVREAGEFEITGQWEPAGALHPSDVDPRWAQSEGECPITLVAAQPVRVSNGPGPLQHARSLASIIDGLLSDDHILNQHLNANLAAGERVSIVNAIYADDAPGEFAYRLDPLSDQATLISGKARGVLCTGPCEVKGLSFDASVAYVSSHRLFAYAGREVRAGDVSLFRTDKPVGLAWDLEEATITVEAQGPVTLTLALKPNARPAVGGAQTDGGPIRLSAGRHRITGADPVFRETLDSTLAGVKADRVQRPARRTESTSPNWAAAWTTQLSHSVRLMKPTPSGEELWISTDGARHYCLGLDGRARWTLELPAPTDALAFREDAALDGRLAAVAGGQDNQLRAFSGDGQLLWSAESEVWQGHLTGPSQWDASWYTDPKRTTGIRSLLVGDLAGAGTPQVLVGRPATLESWTLEGTLVDRIPVRWGEVSQLELLSVGGQQRVLIGNFYTGRDHLPVVGPDMKIQKFDEDRWNYMLPVPPGATEMWSVLQRGVAALRVADLDGDGAQEVVVARGGHWNDLRAYNTDGTQCLWMHSFGPAAPRIVQEHKGRFVRGMSVGRLENEVGETVAIGLANGWTYCFAADGRLIWSRRFSDTVTAVTHLAGRVAVGLADGRIFLVGPQGSVARTAQGEGEVRALVASESLEPLLLAGMDGGCVVALELSE